MALQRVKTAIAVFLLAALAGCSGGDVDDDAAASANPYADDSLWVCKPGAASNRCLELDQTTTYVFSDTSQAVFDHTPATDPAIDCFYLYPSVDYNEVPGNTPDLSDDSLVLRPLYNQAARFTQTCAVYAPLYRQMTYAVYLGDEDYRSTEFFQVAYADAEAAFDQFLDDSGGRPFILMGHSQGSHMLIELLSRRFENDPEFGGQFT